MIVEQENHFNKNEFIRFGLEVYQFWFVAVLLVGFFQTLPIPVVILYAAASFIYCFNKPITLFAVFYVLTTTSELFDGNIFFINFNLKLVDGSFTILANYCGYCLILLAFIKNKFRKFAFYKIDACFIIFLIMMISTGLLSETPSNMYEHMYRMLQFVIIYILLRILLSDSRSIKLFFYTHFLIAIVVIIVLSFQFVFSRMGRPHLIIEVLPYLLSFSLVYKDRISLKWFVILFLATYLSFHSDSRRILIGAVLLYVLFINYRTLNINYIKKTLIAIPLFIILIYTIPDSLMERTSYGFSGLIELAEGVEVKDLHSEVFTKRDELWTIGYLMWQDNFLTGVGTKNVQGLMNSYSDFETDYSKIRMHNLYLRILAEQGIIGFSIFIVILMILFIYLNESNKVFIKNKNRLFETLNRAITFKLISQLVMYFFGGWSIYDKFFWIDSALIVLLHEQARLSSRKLIKV